MGLRLAITGCSSNLGRGLLDNLLRNKNIEQIRGLDLVDPEIESSKFTYFKGDIRNIEDLSNCFRDCDLVIHMAFLVFVAPESREEAEDININGSITVFETAANLGIDKIVYLSSVASYGQHDADLSVTPLKETDPLLGKEAEQFYLYTKGKVEEYLNAFRQMHIGITITHIRPHIILGPSFYETINLANNIDDLEKDRWTWISQKNIDDPICQYTDEEDLIEFISLSIFNDYDGAYNIAGDPLDLREYSKRKGLKLVTVPYWLAKTLSYLSYWLGSTPKVTIHWLPALKYGILADNSKIKEILPSLKSSEEIVDKLYEYVKSRDSQL